MKVPPLSTWVRHRGEVVLPLVVHLLHDPALRKRLLRNSRKLHHGDARHSAPHDAAVGCQESIGVQIALAYQLAP